MRGIRLFTLVAIGLALALATPHPTFAGPPRKMSLVKDYRNALSAARGNPAATIEVHLEFAVKATLAAKEENNPNYMGFTGGADNVQYLQEAKAVLDDLSSEKGAADPEVVALTEKYEAAHAEVAAICDSFNTAKLQNEKAPADVYKGSDRGTFDKQIRAEWAKKYPEDQILDVRFHMAEWQRNKEHVWQSASQSWRDVDMSVLAVSVIVKTCDEVATTYPAYINKNNLSGGAITIGVDTKGSEYVHKEILVATL